MRIKRMVNEAAEFNAKREAYLKSQEKRYADYVEARKQIEASEDTEIRNQRLSRASIIAVAAILASTGHK